MVNIESFSCNTFIVIHIHILQGLMDKSMLNFLQCEKKGFSPLKPMVNINNGAIFIALYSDGKNQLNFAHVLIKMHPTIDKNMGNKPMLVQNFDEQPLVPLNDLISCRFHDNLRVFS